MIQSKTEIQLLEHKSWIDKVVAKQESYLKQSTEVKAKELLVRQYDGAKAIELLAEQETAKTLLQHMTANRTETFRKWFVKQEDGKH